MVERTCLLHIGPRAIRAIMGLVALTALGRWTGRGRYSEDDDEWHFQHNIY